MGDELTTLTDSENDDESSGVQVLKRMDWKWSWYQFPTTAAFSYLRQAVLQDDRASAMAREIHWTFNDVHEVRARKAQKVETYSLGILCKPVKAKIDLVVWFIDDGQNIHELLGAAENDMQLLRFLWQHTVIVLCTKTHYVTPNQLTWHQSGVRCYFFYPRAQYIQKIPWKLKNSWWSQYFHHDGKNIVCSQTIHAVGLSSIYIPLHAYDIWHMV